MLVKHHQATLLSGNGLSEYELSEYAQYCVLTCRARTREMDWTALKLLFEGMEVRQVRRRYALPKATKVL